MMERKARTQSSQRWPALTGCLDLSPPAKIASLAWAGGWRRASPRPNSLLCPGDVYRVLAVPDGYLSNGTFLANLGPISLDTGDRAMRFVVDDLAFGALSCATRETSEER